MTLLLEAWKSVGKYIQHNIYQVEEQFYRLLYHVII